MRLTLFSLALAIGTLILVFELLRRRRLREKYALIWVMVAVAGMVVALAPGLVTGTAALVGVAVPSNLLFVLSLVVLLAISLQLSGEVGELEEQTRTLAEDVARLSLQLHRVEQRLQSEQAQRHPPVEPDHPVDDPGCGC